MLFGLVGIVQGSPWTASLLLARLKQLKLVTGVVLTLRIWRRHAFSLNNAWLFWSFVATIACRWPLVRLENMFGHIQRAFFYFAWCFARLSICDDGRNWLLFYLALVGLVDLVLVTLWCSFLLHLFQILRTFTTLQDVLGSLRDDMKRLWNLRGITLSLAILRSLKLTDRSNLTGITSGLNPWVRCYLWFFQIRWSLTCLFATCYLLLLERKLPFVLQRSRYILIFQCYWLVEFDTLAISRCRLLIVWIRGLKRMDSF